MTTSTMVIEWIADRKNTRLGPGYFVTWVTTYRDEKGEVVGRQTFRILKFKPDLEKLRELLESRQLTPVVERAYPLSESARALGCMGEGHVRFALIENDQRIRQACRAIGAFFKA